MEEEIRNRLLRFFPGETFAPKEVEQGVKDGEIIAEPEKILPFLLTALVDEKVLEAEIDGVPKIYFSRLQDLPPQSPEGVDKEETEDEDKEDEQEYSPGKYLSALEFMLILPVEPGMGNLFLRQSDTVVLRMFTKSLAVELGTSFEELTKIGELPVMRLAFPQILRKRRNVREYRAKVVDSFNFVADVELDEDEEPLSLEVADISISGMALSMNRNEQKLFQEGDLVPVKLYIEDELRVSVDATIRHLSRLRKRTRVEYLCGVEFEPASKYTNAAIESIVAEVQRAHLKELAAKADIGGFQIIN